MPAFLEHWIPIVAPILIAIIGSSSLWGYLERKRTRESSQTKLVKGLTQVLIALKVNEYTERGSVTSDEYATLYNLVYSHYKELGGNGGAERAMRRLENLPVKKPDDLQQEPRSKNESSFWRYPKR